MFRKNSRLAASIILVGLLLSGCREDKADIAQASVQPPASVPIVRFDTLLARIQMGESFITIAKSLGLAESETSLLLTHIKEHFRFRLYAGQQYRVILRSVTAPAQAPDSAAVLEGAAAKGRVIHSFLLEDRYRDRRHILSRSESPSGGSAVVSMGYRDENIPIRTDTVAVAGTVATSLYESFVAKGETPALIQHVTRIFAWDIDFFRDPRVGDGYSILVEKRFSEDGTFRGYGEVLSAQYTNRGQDFYGIRFRGAYYDRNGRSLEKLLLKAPLTFGRVSSGFNTSRLHPVLGVVRPHWGIDYAAPKGTRILAAGDGTVEYSKWVTGYGKTVKIRHNGVYNTYYAHLNGYAASMRPGRRVRQGECIGYLGMTGLATGPHLDYRVERNGKYINPAALKTEPKQGVSKEAWKGFCERRDHFFSRMFSDDFKQFADEPGGAGGRQAMSDSPARPL